MSFLRILAKRGLLNLGIFLLIIVASYGLMKVVPGNPYVGERNVSPEVLAELKKKYDFTLGEYLWGILTRGDFRTSYQHRDLTVNQILSQSLPISLELGFYALALAVVLGSLWGLLAVHFRGQLWEHGFMLVALLGIAIPNFVMGPLLQLGFSMQLGWTPVAGWDTLVSKILPVITLSLMYTAYIARIFRASLIELSTKDFVRTAKAKGLGPWAILFRHLLRGSMVPIVNFLGPTAAALLTGTLVVEKIFNIPGMGRYFVESALQRDYPVALGVLIVYSGLLLTFNLLTDLIQSLLDPRIKFQ